MAAMVLGSSSAFSLGSMKSNILPDVTLDGMGEQKLFRLSNTLHIKTDVTENAEKRIGPFTAGLVATIQIAETLRQYRLLSDMEDNVLADYDEMTLDDVDYITL